MLHIALQADLNPTTLLPELGARGIQQWLYLGEDSTWRVQVESWLCPRMQRLSIADALDAMAWKLRQPYLDWIGDLSQRHHSLAWWASELAAKNPYSLFFLRLCLLGVAQDLLTVGFSVPTLMICATPALAAEVTEFAIAQGYQLQQISCPAPIQSPPQRRSQGRRLLGRIYLTAWQLWAILVPPPAPRPTSVSPRKIS
ncbi:hypothetical protein DO97_14365 [Neosynechococcus sphagnicola sy1]|uniref:Uncharacterized protein n=1 Tax=Neosynechococcus sphagnicola sy1 TaxID=1497020 RepID=A0A098TM67_9CYAN|nr:hypothetical protein DO97_14365 [Neosynechococcus sphagnicola sy1]